ncbi:MAG TPA: tetratricopeptide repeat protein, partial [Thermoanaerobaculia bacterium]
MLVTVEQRSIDLVVEARGPGDKEPYAVTASRDGWGTEVLLLDRTGENWIEVRSRDKASWPGRYNFRIEDLPERTGARHDALALMSRAGRETLPDTQESRTQAEATYRQALAAWRALGERAWETEALTSIGVLEANGSDLKAAALSFRAALPIWHELGKPQREADALDWLGFVYTYTEGADLARETLEASRSLWRTLGEDFDEAQAHGNLCTLEIRSEELKSALACNQETLDFFRSHKIGTQEAEVLNRIGGVYDREGEPEKALEVYRQALPLWHSPGDREGEAKILNNMAVAYRAQGEWQEALRYYDLSRAALGSPRDPALEGTWDNNIASVYSELGEPRRALSLLEKALKRHRTVGDRSAEINSLNNLGAVWRKLGRPEKAVDQHRKALKLAELRKNERQQAASRLGLAEVDLDRGNSAAALLEIEAALLLKKGDRLAQARALYLQGRALILAGRSREALVPLQAVLERRRAVRDRAGTAEALYTLAMAERSLGLADEARFHAGEAVKLVEELRTGVLSADLRAAVLATRRRSYSLLIDLLMDLNAAEPGKNHDSEAFAISERARARGLLDVLRAGGAQRATSTTPPELLTRRTSLLRRLGAKVDQRWKENGSVATALEQDIDGILAELDGVEAEIRRHDPRFAAFSAPQPVSPEEIYSSLEPGTMLLEYSLGDERSFLWAIEAGRIRSFVLPGQARIETLARRVYGTMSAVESGDARRSATAEKLSEILLGPIWSARTKAAP